MASTGKLSHAWPNIQLNRISAISLQVSFGCSTICHQDKRVIDQRETISSPGSPVAFLPAVRTTVDSAGKIVVAIHCVSEASPNAVVSWSKGGDAVTTGPMHHISSDTTQLKIRDYNVSSFLLQNYTCTSRNPLGSQRREIQLKGIQSQHWAQVESYQILKYCLNITLRYLYSNFYFTTRRNAELHSHKIWYITNTLKGSFFRVGLRWVVIKSIGFWTGNELTVQIITEINCS